MSQAVKLSASTPIPWYQEVAPGAWWALALAGTGWTFDVFDTFLLALTLPVLTEVFALDRASAGSIGSLLAAGLVLGGIGFGWLADRIGRVRSLVGCVAIYSLFSGLTALAPTAGMLAWLRFAAGLGMGGTWTAGAALVAESWGTRHRGKGGALMQMGLPIGSMLAIAAAALTSAAMGGLSGNGWRVLYALGVLPILPVVVLARFTPESPLWQKPGAAPQAGTEAAEAGQAGGLVVAFLFIFFCQYIYWGVFTWTPSFLIAVKHLTFVHGLGFVLAQQIGSLAGFLGFAALVDRLGRRQSFLLYLFIGALAVAIFVTATTAAVLVVAIFWSGFGITGLFAGMGPFTAEMVPSAGRRGLGMGLAYNGGRLGGILAPWLIGALATDTLGFQLGMATNIAAFGLAAIIIWMAPETRGTVLR